MAIVFSLGASAGQLRIVQVDLARQMETLPNLSNYVDHVSGLGYDTLHLYLEGRVATQSFSLPPNERYSLEEMRQLVCHAMSRGMTVVPCVGLLGHAEQFFRYPGNEAMDETRESKPRLGGGHNTFCVSSPQTREFLRQYVAEVASAFPGPYFNVGLDEAWNSGVCPLCAPKEARDELFSEAVDLAHEVVTATGKRMWMWDDFFEFHPKALSRVPRDVVLCHWNYSPRISPLGARGHFVGQQREDAVAKYRSMGFDVITACWQHSGNAETMYAYAKPRETMGFMVTQWQEMQNMSLGGGLCRIAAAALLFDDSGRYPLRDPYPDAVARVLPSLTTVERKALVAILHRQHQFRNLDESVDGYSNGYHSVDGLTGLEVAVEVLRQSHLGPRHGEVDGDMFSERAIVDDIVCRAEAGIVADRLSRVVPVFSDPRREASDVRAAKAELRILLLQAEALAARRRRQAEVWRPGCAPREMAVPVEKAVGLMKNLLSSPETTASADERMLEVDLVLPDEYGLPWWSVCGRFGEEWRQLGKGVWKPGLNDGAAFAVRIPFKSTRLPTELRIEHTGYGRAQVAYVSVWDRNVRCVPNRILSVVGDVEHVERLLVDDYEWADFGTPGFLEKYYDRGKAERISSVTLALRGDEEMTSCRGRKVECVNTVAEKRGTSDRRDETLQWFLENEYGRRPDVAENPKVSFERMGEDVTMMDGHAVRFCRRISYSGPYGTNAFLVTAFVPTGRKGAVPSFLLICNRDPSENIDPERVRRTEFWPAEEIVRRGYATIAFYNGDVAPDCAVGNSEGVFACYEDVQAWRKNGYRPHNAWGTLSAWAWGASRVMDWIVTEPLLDSSHVAVVGHSRGGKTALLAGVLDCRFAMACVNDSGCSGAKLNHMSLPGAESIAIITRSFPYWFCNNYRLWVNREWEMPFDQHQFLALMAPRLVAVGSAVEDLWAGPAGEEMSCRLARLAWDSPDKVDYHIRAGGHDLNLVDWKAYMDFADSQGWNR